MIRIQELSTGNLYDIGHPYEGGTIQLRGQCPVLRRAGVIIIDQDKGEYQLERDLSFLFRYYDTENPPTDPEPDNPDPIPLDCSISPPEIQPFPAKFLLEGGNTVFSCIINNPNNYAIEFSTSVLGGLDANGQPSDWETVGATNGIYLIETETGGLQNIWTRWATCTNRRFHTFDSTHGTVDPDPPGDGDARVDSIPWLLLDWGSGGEVTPAAQGTHEFETWGLSQPEFKSALPWFGIEIVPETIEVDDYVNGVLQWENNQPKKKSVTRNVDFLVTDSVMQQATEYLIQAGIQGWAFLYYANDSPLNIWRKAHKNLVNKRGTKAISVVYALGGGRENYPVSSVYSSSINEIASDINQPWWVRVQKNGQQVPVLMCLIEDINSVWDRITDMNRILEQANVPDAYKVIMTTFPEVAQLAGAGQYFDAWSVYYTDGAAGQGYSGVRTKLQQMMNNNANKFVPMASCGLDQRARNFMLNEVKGYFEYSDVLNNIGGMITDVESWKSNPANGCKFALTGVNSEYTEQGKGFLPSRWIDYQTNQNLDRRMIDIWKAILYPNFIP